ncbi:MAG: hypothetical protein ACTS27_13335, partial [Phycisphaerales bacterium]
ILNSTVWMPFFGIENYLILPILGIILILFSCFVYFVITKAKTHKKLVVLIIFLDILWVVGSLAITFFDLFPLNKSSYPVIHLLAICVGTLAVGQMYFLKNKIN